ncbi:MAG: glutathione peroxidase [Pikeienuella sp.]
MRNLIVALMFSLMGFAASAEDFSFPSIDGGDIALSDYHGGPVLVVNTASRCGYTYQYKGLQALYDQYRDKGLTVLAVPSRSFRQELTSNEAVKEFCEVTYGLDLPMTEVTPVTGPKAHPFYQWVEAETGFAPSWNFNKVLLDGEGRIIATYRSRDNPTGGQIERAVVSLLGS